ncbi:MAG: hypothetical protein IJS97_09615 [Prevotella sp.]|nr:hypothetical protein [Prevotella sp.]
MHLFKLKKEEIYASLVALMIFISLNGLMIFKYYERFTRGGNLGFWSLFYGKFQVSGFDCLTYITLSRWKILYSLYRHPLLATLMYPFAQLNDLLMGSGRYNYAVFIVATILVVCAFYSFLFMYRIQREVIGLSQMDATLMSAFFFGFGYVMLTVMVPDHFCVSMFLLTMTLYIAGRRMRSGRMMKAWQTMLLLFFTTGVTTTNGIKPLLADLFVNRRQFFQWRHLLVAVFLPVVLLGGWYAWQYTTIVLPESQQNQVEMRKKFRKNPEYEKKIKTHNAWREQQSGKPVMDHPMFEYTNISSPRVKSMVENLFGESIQLHDDHLLEDLNVSRPVFVTYRWVMNYVVEAVIVLLFVLGIVFAWKLPFMQLCLSWFAFDMLLHIGLGFGINEVYIMSAHWIFIMPIAIGFLLHGLSGHWQVGLRCLLLVLALWLWAWNGWLITGYMIR